MKNILKYIYISIILTISLAPAVLYAVVHSIGVGDAANIEKTENIAFPSIVTEGKINASFDDECEKWLNQNIPFRGAAISEINVALSDCLKMPTSNVITGREGWIFSEETTNDYLDTNTLSDRDLRSIGITLSLIQERMEACGGDFLFVPVPNKNTVYPEYMPERYEKADENNYDRLMKVLDSMEVNHTDLKHELTQARETNPDIRLYYKRDTHWTAPGALIGYENMMEKLGRTPGKYATGGYHVENTKRGDLDKLLFPALSRTDEEYLTDDLMDYDSFEFTYPAGITDTKSQLENFMSDKEDHDNNFTTKKTKDSDGSSLYMVRDSFARALLPYMIDSYDEATFVRSVTPSFEDFGNGRDVIYEICERNLSRLIESAPFVYAPERDKYSSVMYVYDSDCNRCYVTDEGYAYRIFGTIDAKMVDEDDRIFVRLNGGTEERVFEAFPIYEDSLMTQAEINGDDITGVTNSSASTGENDLAADTVGVCGFSMYLDKNVLNPIDYRVKIASENYESDYLTHIDATNTDNAVDEDDESVTEGSDDAGSVREEVNPYPDENAGHQIKYRGVTIGIGDNMSDLKAALGNQSAPAETITSCLSGTDAVLYYYPGITLETDTNGLVYYISLMDNSYSDGKEAASCENGIALGSDRAEIIEKAGQPTSENDNNCTYRSEHLVVMYSYKNDKVTSVILEDARFFKEADREDGQSDDADKTAESDAVDEDSKNNEESSDEETTQYAYVLPTPARTGWQIIDGQYCFYDRLNGDRIVGRTIDGITIGPGGEVNLTEYDRLKIETMMKANRIVKQVTSPTDTMEEKRRKVFDWVLSFPYYRARRIKDVYTEQGIEIVEANDIFDGGAGDCVSESAALAFLFHEIGYNNVYWVHDTGHSWVRSDDRLFDPLFAESRDFDANYNAVFKDYRAMMTYSMLIY